MRTLTLTAERLRSLLDYNRETGVFVWRAGRRVGRVAGTRHHTGYLFIKIDRVTHLAQRLAWLYETGAHPAHDVEHRDLNKANTRRPERNTSGHKGVTWHKSAQKWQAHISRGGYLGLYDCPAAAHFAYVVAADKAYGEYARAA